MLSPQKNLNHRRSKLLSRNKWRYLKLRLYSNYPYRNERVIKRLVDEVTVDFISKYQSKVEEKVVDQANNSKLRILSEYNRRNNVRITDLSEEIKQSENRKEYEQENVTLTQVIDLARQIDATIDEKNVSIAH